MCDVIPSDVTTILQHIHENQHQFLKPNPNRLTTSHPAILPPFSTP